MGQAEDFVDILLVLKEQLFIYINSGIAEQDSEEQISAFPPTALYGSDYQVIIEDKPRISS